jgi:hypothetical protein
MCGDYNAKRGLRGLCGTQPAPAATVVVYPDYYAWDGYEYVGLRGGQYFYLNPGGAWVVCDPVVVERFHGWERYHLDWARTATRYVPGRPIEPHGRVVEHADRPVEHPARAVEHTGQPVEHRESPQKAPPPQAKKPQEKKAAPSEKKQEP